MKPDKAFLAIPTRSPAERWVQYPSETFVNRASQMLSQRLNQVEYLIGYEGNDFAFTGNVEEDLLCITSVHPMRKEAVCHFLDNGILNEDNVDWQVVINLCAQKKSIETSFDGHKLYMRKLHDRHNNLEVA